MTTMRNLIRKVPLFSELNDSETDAVMALVSTRNVPRKSIVVQEGDVGDSLFIILKGSVKISSYTAEGKEVVLSLLGEGGVFGEMALLDRQPRTLSLKQLLEVHIRHRQDVIRRRSTYLLRKARQRAHVVEGLTLPPGDYIGNAPEQARRI